MTGVWSYISCICIHLCLRGGVWRREQRDKKRQSNQLGFQGLCSTFPYLIRYSSNSPPPKNTQGDHPNEEWSAAMSATMQAVSANTGFPNIFTSQTSYREIQCLRCSSATFSSSPVMMKWLFCSNVNLGPILWCNDLTAVTFMGTRPMTLQVESCCHTGIRRQTDTSSGNGVEIRGNVWRRGESSLETQ